jgi:hypothetical protein
MAAVPQFLNGERFNDEFYIFQGHRGDLFYHGSPPLASDLVSFPVGVDLPNNLRAITPQVLNNEIALLRTNPPEEINSIISRLGRAVPAFFSNVDT